MILSDNILILRNRFPAVLDRMKAMEEELAARPVEVVQAKNGQPNLTIARDSETYYVHSKYNPVNEAEKFVEQFDIQPGQHVFFYGLGLGYHIKALLSKASDVSFSIYEPDPAILYAFLCTCNLRDFTFKQLRHIYLGSSEGETTQQLSHFVQQVKEPVLFVPHPAYRLIMNEESVNFEAKFRRIVQEKRSLMWTNIGYEKLWIVNSGNNLSKVLSTPSVLRQKKTVFQGKPVLLVAAGPSLDEEIENIRHIKENGLAYIFAVGSANKALLHRGIHPDAVTAYDPTQHNHIVYEEIISQRIDTIPLIFGSSGSYNTVEMYPGPKLHMITSQDPISTFLLGGMDLKKKGEIISDAPSIAVLTLELLVRLECRSIILVGQNFGYRNDQYYAGGISYNQRPTELTERDRRDLKETEGVEGGRVLSNDGHLRAKRQMEGMLLRVPRHIEIINTTVGGAKIEGTVFARLNDVIAQKLKEKVVEPGWYEYTGEFSYDADLISKQAELLDEEFEQFVTVGNELLAIMRKLDGYCSGSDARQVNRILPRFDRVFKRLMNNKYVTVLIVPLIRVQYEVFMNSIAAVRAEADAVQKARAIIKVFGKFIGDCQSTHEKIGVILYQQMRQNVARLAQQQ